MGFLQQAGKTIGSQQTSGGLLQQAGVSSLSESPKITVAPKKKTTAQVTVSKPNSISTPVQSDGFLSTVKKTTSNIIGDIKLSLAPKKIVSPIPDSQIIKQTVSNKKISILPGQKYLEPKQLQKAFPQTATAIQDFKTPQKTDAKKAAIDAWSAIKDPFIEQIKRQQENMMPSKTLAEKTAKQLKVYTGFANVAMSPISAVFGALNNSNLKGATKALAIPFVAVGEGASKISDKIIDELPLDKKTKETLKPAFSEAASLAAQVALGEIVKVGTKKAKSTINRVGPEVFEKFTKNVIEESGSSKTINLTAEQVRDIQRNMATKEVVDMVAKLDLKSSEWRKAVTDGLTIEIPAEKITRIMDKPYWEKMKSVFGKKPTDVVKTSTGTPSTRTGFAGYLTDGTYTPQEVIGKVIGSPLEKTPEGKALVKSALDAQKRGMDIEVTSAKEGTPPPSPTAKKTGGGVVKEGSAKPQATELAKQDNAVKKSILEQFSTNEIRAMRAIKRSVSALEKKGLDATNVTKTQSYKDHIEGVMSALNTNSEDVALDYILNELPDALTSASTRQDLEEIKVLKSRIMPKEVSVPREQLPTGEGKPKVSKLEARMKGVMDKATKEQIEDLGLSTYNTLNRKETIAKAAEYVLENPKEALSVLQGNTQAPEGIPPEAIYVALTQVAKGDLTLATKLASLQATALGQRISLLAELDPNSPVKLLNEVYKVREELAKKRHGGKSVKEVKEKIVKQIKEKVKAPDKYDWNNFISALEC